MSILPGREKLTVSFGKKSAEIIIIQEYSS